MHFLHEFDEWNIDSGPSLKSFDLTQLLYIRKKTMKQKCTIYNQQKAKGEGGDDDYGLEVNLVKLFFCTF